MTTPQPGDRVRVTFEATYKHAPGRHFGGYHGVQVGSDDPHLSAVPVTGTVEVLPPPVYANHDTTAWQNGDVVRTELGSALVRQDDCWNGATSGIGYGDSEVRELTLTLLVRDGQVIA